MFELFSPPEELGLPVLMVSKSIFCQGLLPKIRPTTNPEPHIDNFSVFFLGTVTY
ncbi:hypothetical protein D082_27590 [Synechocystis sp. PCC 6714]|nr:hypothetical protein D082_27590 [Synechocystis sp. PCC 6714]